VCSASFVSETRSMQGSVFDEAPHCRSVARQRGMCRDHVCALSGTRHVIEMESRGWPGISGERCRVFLRNIIETDAFVWEG